MMLPSGRTSSTYATCPADPMPALASHHATEPRAGVWLVMLACLIPQVLAFPSEPDELMPLVVIRR